MKKSYILYNRIKILRKSRGLSQNELANLCDTTQNTISSLENGCYSPSAYLSARICKALDCSWEECFYYENK